MTQAATYEKDADGDIVLSCCIRDYPFTEPLKSGRIKVPGVKFNFVDVKPHIAAFRRMVRQQEFDLCEIAPTTYVIARGYDVPIVALPIFFVRRFHHEGLLARPDSGIKGPRDLAGKRIGVRAYSVTTGVWKRGILQNEYGLDISSVTWVIDDEEHVQALKLPANVEQVAEGKSIAGMLASGEIHAGFTGEAGVGRAGKPTDGWSEVTELPSDLFDIFAGEEAAEREWFERTGILPMHGTLALKSELAAEHPELVGKIYAAFLQARDEYIADLQAGRATGKQAEKDAKLAKLVGDPLPYGLENNRASIEALIQYAHQQGLIPTPLKAEQVFLSY